MNRVGDRWVFLARTTSFEGNNNTDVDIKEINYSRCIYRNTTE